MIWIGWFFLAGTALAGEDLWKSACETQNKICTREYSPTECSLGGVSAQGSNACTAKSHLIEQICQKKGEKKGSPEEIQCHPASSPQ
jgi:hypothetical protein